MGQPVISLDISVSEGHHHFGLTEGVPDHATATACFTAECIRSWWGRTGKAHHPDATEAMVVMEHAMGHRRRMMSMELGKLATETGLTFHVMHLPPGISRWNSVVNRMTFSIGSCSDASSGMSMSAVVSTIAASESHASSSFGPSAHGVISLKCDGGWDYSVDPGA